MKKINLILFACSIALMLISCSKSSVKTTPLASLEIVNAVINSPGANLGSNPNTVYPGSYGQFGLIAGNSAIYVWPVGDSSQPYFNNNVTTVNGGIYSLFLAGGLTGVDTLLVHDTIPSYSDSSAGIRFINLSPGTNPVSIDIMGMANGSEAASLPYESITSFKKYSANSANTNYNFEIRDAVSDSLLYSFSQAPALFKNITIVIDGQLSDGSFGIFTVNNY